MSLRSPLLTVTSSALAMLLGAMAFSDRDPTGPAYTLDFGLRPGAQLSHEGGGPFLSLQPGVFQRLEGEDDGEWVRRDILVLSEVKPLSIKLAGGTLDVPARVIEEREWSDGELTEVARLFYARCVRTGNIYCFGADVSNYEDGKLVDHEGTWFAGRDGALPGLAMPGTFLLGARYHTSYAPGVSVDFAENLSMALAIYVEAGAFAGGIMIRETSPLDPDEETLKIYAPDVGIAMDGALQLVAYRN